MESLTESNLKYVLLPHFQCNAGKLLIYDQLPKHLNLVEAAAVSEIHKSYCLMTPLTQPLQPFNGLIENVSKLRCLISLLNVPKLHL